MALRFFQVDVVDRPAETIHRNHRSLETGHTPPGGTPVGEDRKVVHEPPQTGLYLVESADGYHQLTKSHLTRQIGRRGYQDRRHEREPAIAGGDPGKAGRGSDGAPGHLEDALEHPIE